MGSILLSFLSPLSPNFFLLPQLSLPCLLLAMASSSAPAASSSAPRRVPPGDPLLAWKTIRSLPAFQALIPYFNAYAVSAAKPPAITPILNAMATAMVRCHHCSSFSLADDSPSRSFRLAIRILRRRSSTSS